MSLIRVHEGIAWLMQITPLLAFGLELDSPKDSRNELFEIVIPYGFRAAGWFTRSGFTWGTTLPP